MMWLCLAHDDAEILCNDYLIDITTQVLEESKVIASSCRAMNPSKLPSIRIIVAILFV